MEIFFFLFCLLYSLKKKKIIQRSHQLRMIIIQMAFDGDLGGVGIQTKQLEFQLGKQKTNKHQLEWPLISVLIPML